MKTSIEEVPTLWRLWIVTVPEECLAFRAFAMCLSPRLVGEESCEEDNPKQRTKRLPGAS